MSKKRIMITGSGGFLASNFIRQMIYNKHYNRLYDIVSIDRVSEASILNSIYSNKNHEFYIADITDEHIVNIIMEATRPDIVLHMAAYTSVDESIKDPSNYVLNNVYGTQVIINASIKWKVKKFIYTSTDEIYGQLNNENEPAWTELSPPTPRNPYSASKLAGEYLVKAAGSTYGLDYYITRCSNIYGTRQTHNKLIPRTIKSILDNEPIIVYGKGNNIRSWIYTSDVCSAIIKIIEDGQNSEIYNISSNQEYSNIEVVQMICNAMDSGYSLIKHIEDPRPGHDFRYALDASKLKMLGWEPKVKFKDGIKQTVDWYQANRYLFR
jgi:dTDP-glucose 4,6-dehydratase